MSEFDFLLSALSVTSRLCVKNVAGFSQRRKEDPKPQSKLRHYSEPTRLYGESVPLRVEFFDLPFAHV